MPGFFRDTSGLDNNDSGLSTNNAARDFERSGATPSGLFDRLFGRSPSGQITSQPLSPPPAAAPSISSAPSLVARILQASAPPPPAPPSPGPQTRPPFDPSMLRAAPVDQPAPLPPFQYPGASAARAPLPPAPMSLPPYEGIPQFGPNMSPQRPQEFGGNRFGGAQFGGNRFGGSRLSPQDAAALSYYMQQLPGNDGSSPDFRRGGPVGYFRGGPMRLARGGYPQLMGGLPERQPFAGAGYVKPDGQGDGRSDHIEAVLSPGEFVADAETVSLLGNGDNDAGARGMEAIRQEIRKHKGKALAKGKFSPDAQSPTKLVRIGARAAKEGSR